MLENKPESLIFGFFNLKGQTQANYQHISYYLCKMTFQVRELLLENGSSPYADWFNSLSPDVAVKVVTAKLRMELGNTSSIKWFRGMGEYRIDYGPGWRIYLAKDGLQLIILLGGGSKKSQQKDIETAAALWAGYKQRKAAAIKLERKQAKG